MIKRLLVANRGEIAARVILAARTMGIETVAIFTPVDSNAHYLDLATYSVALESKDGRSGYLDIEQVVQVALKYCCDAVHPGYGFLSENASFARACEEHDITFVGPNSRVIASLGDKNEARKIMREAGVPMLPGSNDPVKTVEEGLDLAQEIGYPVLIKAVAGGGGRGMRLVTSSTDFRELYEQAQREAKASFGNDAVFVEKYLNNPRHIEIQILGDNHGAAIHLGERECSIQRRFQKMLEESPSPAMTPELRRSMGEASVQGAKAVGYSGAGTFEYLVDDDLNFYFLEVNTRLQVEHPVTEVVTGVDLVKAQLRVASGEPLWLGQDDIKLRGHAVECRINCEDSLANFMPSPGIVHQVYFPKGARVRVDSHLYSGYEIPRDFDSMVAKLIVSGENRDDALANLAIALQDFFIAGVPTTIPFHQWLISHPEFIAGNLSTHFLQHYSYSPTSSLESEQRLENVAMALSYVSQALVQQ